MSRLPITGQDDNVWGQILNDYLLVSNNPDGTLQLTAITDAGGYAKPAGGIPSTDMSSAVKGALDAANTSVQSVNSKAPLSGNVNLNTADLTDTNIAGPANNQVLTYNSISNKWINQTPASGVGLDNNASDIQPLGVQSAGSTGKAADAGHVHAMPSASAVGAVSVINGGEETTATPIATTGTTIINLANGNVQLLTLATDTTIDLSGATNGVACSLSLYIAQDPTGGRAVTWGSSIKWPGAAAPTLSTGPNDVDLVVLESLDGGTTWYGTLSGANFG